MKGEGAYNGTKKGLISWGVGLISVGLGLYPGGWAYIRGAGLISGGLGLYPGGL